MASVHYKGNVDIVNRIGKELQEAKVLTRTLAEFRTKSTFHEKIDFALGLLRTRKYLPKFIKDEKSNDRSGRIRKKGNKRLTSNKNKEEALETFCYSLATAKSPSYSKGLAHCNRSEVLYQLKLYDDCLRDIGKALEYDFEEDQKEELVMRRENAERLKDEVTRRPYHQPLPEIYKMFKNPLIESASNFVRIALDPKYGRSLVATKHINIGEIIAIEKPAYSLLLENRWCMCHHCLELCYSMDSCENCTQALFCSAECKENAKKYHDYECRILATLHTLQLGSSLLPLRIGILLKDDYNGLEDEVKKKDTVYRSNRYREIHNLCHNIQHRDLNNLFEKSLVSAILFYVLNEYTDFFKDADESYINLFKKTLMHNLLVMSVNFSKIHQLYTNLMYNNFHLSSVGVGAYSLLSLVNHSCVANCYRFSYGSTQVLKAILTIKKGDQLFNCYRKDYTTANKETRQALLKKQYFFVCECLACTRNWPVLNALPSYNPPQHYAKMANYLDRSIEEIEAESRRAARTFEKRMPCRDLCDSQEVMKQCHCLWANVKYSLKSEFEL